MSVQETIERSRPEGSGAQRALLDAVLRGQLRTPAVTRRAHGPDVPLSFAQERLWFLDRLQPGGTAYNLLEALRITGGVDEAALERALGEVVRRHDALRTVFREVDGAPLQGVEPFGGFQLPIDDLTPLPAAERDAETRRRADAEAAHAFDLTRGPLFRARLLRLADDEHVLLLCIHHAVCDAWSLRVLLRETWALYGAYRDGRASPLPAPALRYADFAAWQREQCGTDAEARHVAWWKAQLAGAPEVLELPADHPRPPLPSFRGATVPVEIAGDVLERLRELARAEDATLFMAVLAAFQVLLGRYGASDDVVVGTPVAARARPELEGLVGLFANTLVVRTDLSGDPTLREVVRRVRGRVLGAHEHGDVPFERLVGALQPGRSLSHTTIFQVLFQLEGAGEPPSGAPGIGVEALDVEVPAARYDLSLDLRTGGRGVEGVLRYSTDLFERGTARRMTEHLGRVLEQMSADPDRRLSRLALMSRTEKRRVVEWNRVTARYPADRCIHQLFEAQAERTPDAMAVAFGAESMTYGELDARANRIAHHLVRMGVGPEVRVGICLERGLELLPALLGVMKAGGAYVPMDPAHPAERLAYVMEDSGAAVLLVQDRLRARVPVGGGVRVVSVDGAADAIAAEPADAPETGVTAENLAYVIYTSGSTGRPKGVAMHHRGVANYVYWGVRAYGADGGSGAPVFSSMAVDLTITNLLPLFAGRTVRLLREDSPVEALAEALREKPWFGLIKITPIHLGLLNAMLRPDEMARAAHTLVVGADFLNAEPTVPWQAHAPNVRLMNEYGPTETVVGCSAYVLPTGRHRVGPVPVGRPIQNLHFYVLDAGMEPVPVGLPGELYIGGAGVARGYLGRAGLTADRFLPDPWAQPGARMYRTGDRARWMADGNLLILGRTDNQVKVRGFRVELGEIEAALRRRPEVAQCFVLVREDRPGDRRLVAYVTGGGADAATLREHLRRTLPEYMVPDAFVLLPSLPQAPTGKLDRRALPAPDVPGGDGERDAPADELESRLVALWEELLGVEGIGVTQNFFELGGNSLLALRLFALMDRVLGCHLPVAALFAGPTVRQLAAAIREQQPA